LIHQLNTIPLWAVTILFACLLLGSMALGGWLRRFVAVDPASVGSGQLIFGTFSVLSLLVGFTFSLALNRYDQRRDLLLEESNAIRAMHRILVHVEEPGRSEISAALRLYSQGRLAFVQSNYFQQADMVPARAAEREHLNRVVGAVVPTSETGVTQAQILAAATRILDAGTRMDAVTLAHVPPRVILHLVFLSAGCALIIGISIADKLPSLWLPATLWAFLLSIALFTIVDLDAPHWGSIRLDPGPLQTAVRVTGAASR
jgi:FtsH-binding integral membrane protein